MGVAVVFAAATRRADAGFEMVDADPTAADAGPYYGLNPQDYVGILGGGFPSFLLSLTMLQDAREL